MSGWRTPAFWWRARPTLAARLLAPLGHLYGAVTAARMETAPRASASLPVVCVGNFVVGGSGKTPFALALAELLTAQGEAPVFLTRGYGGSLSGRDPVIVDRHRHRAAGVGDEALLLAAIRPTVMSADRPAGARAAAGLGSLIVMDDGFQNPSLAKTLSLVLVDAATGIGNGLCLPAGPLRAPLERQLAHADALVVVGREAQAEPVVEAARARGLPVFRATVEAVNGADFAGQRVLAFSGIGRGGKFLDSLHECGAEIVASQLFGDHHAYGEAEARSLLARARDADLTLATTAKDRVRLTGAQGGPLAELASVARVLEIGMRIANAGELVEFVTERLAGFRKP